MLLRRGCWRPSRRGDTPSCAHVCSSPRHTRSCSSRLCCPGVKQMPSAILRVRLVNRFVSFHFINPSAAWYWWQWREGAWVGWKENLTASRLDHFLEGELGENHFTAPASSFSFLICERGGLTQSTYLMGRMKCVSVCVRYTMQDTLAEKQKKKKINIYLTPLTG